VARALLLLPLAVITACVQPVTVDRSEVVGTYVLYIQGYRDELTLRADGTYQHLVPRVDEGNWTLESAQTAPVLFSTFFHRHEARLAISTGDDAPCYTKQ